MDNPAQPDPSQELASPPEEKLLRAPSFWEKNGKFINGVLIVAFIFVLAVLAVYLFVPTEMPSWLQAQACKADAKLCPSPTPMAPHAMPTIDMSNPETTCTPRPACLDATPKCDIPETSNMCPKDPDHTMTGSESGQAQSPTEEMDMSSGETQTQNSTSCPSDVRLCQKTGTYVGRSGPNCEFICN